MNKKLKKLISISMVLLMIVASSACFVAAYTEIDLPDGSKQVNVLSGAPRASSFVSINSELADKAQGLNLIMCGLTTANKDVVIDAIGKTYDPNSKKAIKYVDESFVDAEKYDANAEPPDPETHLPKPYDSYLCWAGAISNMAWMSGWAQGLTDFANHRVFASEDDVFTFFNCRVVNGGSQTARGIKFFYQGMLYTDTTSSGNATICVLGQRDQYGEQLPEDGLRKDIVSELIVQDIDIYKNPKQIAELEKLCTGTGNDEVFEASVGTIDAGRPIHALTVAGIVIDPTETEYADRYKAILIINTDNDGEPTEEEKRTITEDAQREASKAERPNSYTLYPLSLVKDEEGNDCWELIGYGEDREILYDCTSLKCKSASVIEEATETEGSKDSINNADLLITKPSTKGKYEVGEEITLDYELRNHSVATVDDKYTTATSVPVSYKVVRNGSEVVCEGVTYCDLPIPGDSEYQYNIKLNNVDGKLQNWGPGNYEVFMEVNPKINGTRTILESYYKNNDLASCEFTITDKDDPVTPDTPTGKTTNTGDNNSPIVYFVLLLMSAFGIGAGCLRKLRKKNEE